MVFPIFVVFSDPSSSCLLVWTGICCQTVVETWCKRQRQRQSELVNVFTLSNIVPWDGCHKEENVLCLMFHCAGKYICSSNSISGIHKSLPPVSIHQSCYVTSLTPTYLSSFSIMAPTPIKLISHFSTVKGCLMNFCTLVTENEWGDYYQLHALTYQII